MMMMMMMMITLMMMMMMMLMLKLKLTPTLTLTHVLVVLMVVVVAMVMMVVMQCMVRQQEEKKKAKQEASKAGSSSKGHAGASNQDVAEDNDDECFACGSVGDLLCCSFCSCSFHLACVKQPLLHVPEDEWECPECEREARERSGATGPQHEAAVGWKVNVLWPKMKKWYTAIVQSYNPVNKLHTVQYVCDGLVKQEPLQRAGPDAVEWLSMADPSEIEIHPKKKAKTGKMIKGPAQSNTAAANDSSKEAPDLSEKPAEAPKEAATAPSPQPSCDQQCA